MKIIQSAKSINTLSVKWRMAGKRISLVPTMGCLHEGHLSLMRKAKAVSDRVIVSLFVNPIQFSQGEDFDSYPNQFEKDCELIENEGVDVLFSPTSEGMYSNTFQTGVSVKSLSKGMCGKGRPGHFDGVATVVAKLFNITCPDLAVFGEKDFQQLVIIRQLVKDLNYNVEIVGAPIVREEDGLAMSSRNFYLDSEGRKSATCLYQAIQASKNIITTMDKVPAAKVIELTEGIVAGAGAQLEYAVIVNQSTLESDEIVNKNSVLALAVRVGNSVRLIDNSKLMA